jgi:hypothetical protein
MSYAIGLPLRSPPHTGRRKQDLACASCLVFRRKPDSRLQQIEGLHSADVWSGASFDDQKLEPGTGKFKDASIRNRSMDEVNRADIKRWVEKAREIQWDYKNISKRKGVLERLR